MHREKLDNFIGPYWEFYDKLLDYKKRPGKALAQKIGADFDELFNKKTNYYQLDKLIEKTCENKNKLLDVLIEPEVPLHNSLAELGAGRRARKRDIPYHTMSGPGTICLGAFMTITQTAIQHNIDVVKYIKQMTDQDKNRLTLPTIIKLKILNTSVF
jgi:hypothetical protein